MSNDVALVVMICALFIFCAVAGAVVGERLLSANERRECKLHIEALQRARIKDAERMEKYEVEMANLVRTVSTILRDMGRSDITFETAGDTNIGQFVAKDLQHKFTS